MKKYNIPFVTILVLLTFVPLAPALYTLLRKPPVPLLCIFFFYLVIMWVVLGMEWAGHFFMNRTLKERETFLEQHGLHPVYTHETYDVIHFFDPEQGKLGILFCWNPWKLQVVEGSQIDHIRVDDGVDETGGTNLICCRFTIDGKQQKIPTFIGTREYKDMPLTEPITEKALERATNMAGFLQQMQEYANETPSL